MPNQSQLKSDKLRAGEDGLRQLQAKDRKIEEQIHKRIEVQHQLDELKLEHTHEVWLLKQEVKNLEEKNKAQRKSHQGNSLPSSLAS
jgi:hypothetical protein